jgi:hypothetical protein
MNDSFSSLNFTSEIKPSSIEELIEQEENMYILENSSDKYWANKYKNLNEFRNYLNKKELISLEDFTKLKEYATSKGGFLTNELRKDLWKKIYCVDDNKNNNIQYNFYYVNEKLDKFEDNNNEEMFIVKREPLDLSKINIILYFMLIFYYPNSNKIRSQKYNYIRCKKIKN